MKPTTLWWSQILRLSNTIIRYLLRLRAFFYRHWKNGVVFVSAQKICGNAWFLRIMTTKLPCLCLIQIAHVVPLIEIGGCMFFSSYILDLLIREWLLFFFLPSDFILFYLDVGLLYVYVFFENLGIRINICVRKFGIDHCKIFNISVV